ncbi:hypothetical protein GQX74_000801 [Glossina fuscipes]|nr:hypothetical protein GQX74_000801 [Glossina fuscipes]
MGSRNLGDKKYILQLIEVVVGNLNPPETPFDRSNCHSRRRMAQQIRFGTTSTILNENGKQLRQNRHLLLIGALNFVTIMLIRSRNITIVLNNLLCVFYGKVLKHLINS